MIILKKDIKQIEQEFVAWISVKVGFRACFLRADTSVYFILQQFTFYVTSVFNPLKPELNPICYLLALLGAHHLFHVSRIRVKLLTLR